MNPRTQRYIRYGMHAILDHREKEAWLRHLQGEPHPLRDLPTNGDHCPERTMGGYCGFALFVDATCPNSANHRDVVEGAAGEPEVTDEMVDAAYTVLPGWVARELESQLMRAAITAALAAREDQP
jgi:hypothetical protein